MSADIGGVVFFEWLLEDGKIEPDSGDERLQEEEGEFPDNASQFSTETIKYTEYHDIYDNLADQPSDEEPPEAIAEWGQNSVQLLFVSILLAL